MGEQCPRTPPSCSQSGRAPVSNYILETHEKLERSDKEVRIHSKEREDRKKNQMEILELKYTITEIEKKKKKNLNGWAQWQKGKDRGKKP